jgi:phosphatidylinositol alpha-1,6-mannosyltransferase
VILTVARLEERKGIDTMLRAMPRILHAEPSAKYLVVGDGADRRRLETMRDAAGLADAVVFCGAVPYESPELVAYYRTCDVFAMPNRTLSDGNAEGFGLVFLEAGACGKPVVGGSTGGVRDAVDHDVTGLLVSGDSETETADAIVRLLRDPAYAGRLGAAGRRKAEDSRWQKRVALFRECCVELTAGRQEPRASGPRYRARG